MDNVTYYTQNNGTVYAITTAWPDDNMLTLTYPVPTGNTEITMVGYPKVLNYKYDSNNGINVTSDVS
jgi:hypothetical protein